MRKVSNVFLMIYICLFPIWLGAAGYTNIQETKTEFFWVWAKLFLIVCGISLCIAIPLWREENQENTHDMDYKIVFLSAGFLLTMIVAWFCNGRMTNLLTGKDGRNLGLYAWIVTIAAFLLIAHLSEKSKTVELSLLIPVMIVSFVAYLNFLGFNVFGASVIDIRKSVHISTIGNIDLVASYLGMTLSYIMGRLCLADDEDKMIRILRYIVCFWGFEAMISSNSDTGYLVVGVILMILPFMIEKEAEIKRYLLIFQLFALAGIYAKLSQVVRGSEQCRTLYGLSYLHTCTWIAVLLWIAAGIAYLIAGKRTKQLLIMLRIAIISVFVGILILLFLANLSVIKEKIIGYLGIYKSYLVFSDDWGTGRGVLWRSAVETFVNMPVLQKIIGVSAGGYYDASHKYLSQETLDAMERGTQIIDPHNALLQSLVNFGVIGTLLLVGLIGYCVYLFVQRSKTERGYLAFVLFIIAYLLQASVNYFHIFTEPYVLFWIAYGLSCRCDRKADYGRNRKKVPRKIKK